MKQLIMILSLWMLVVSQMLIPNAWAVENKETTMNIPMVPASAEFERIKSLAGIWEGTSETHGKMEPAKVEYSVTSGGTVVLEKLFPGTPHEMVSVYYDENGKLTMTHYCMLPAKPKMDLKSSTEKEIVFDYSASNQMDTSKMHMHALKLSFPAPGEMIQTWDCFEGGKSTHNTVISFKKNQSKSR